MAFKLLRACRALSQINLGTKLVEKRALINPICQNEFLKRQDPVTSIIRQGSFFNKLPASHLWKSATHVSNAGRKRGRTKSRRQIKDLNKGQRIGVGKVNMIWPGLNSPVTRGREFVRQQELPEDPEREKKLFELRDSMTRKRRIKLSPLERGWSGGKPGGRKIGPPDPIGEDTFEGFDSRILDYKLVSIMTGNLGRVKRVSSFVITGNGNGLVGFGLAKGVDGRSVLKRAKNRAALKLMFIKRDGDSVYHDFCCRFDNTKIYVSKKSPGYGLRCQRAIKTMCEVIGIKDLHAKIEGSTNLKNVVKAFLIGLLQQKTHDQIAEDKKLHLVEFRKENDNFPRLVASPTKVRKPEEIPSTEILDFKQYIMDGKVVLQKQKPVPFWERQYSWVVRQRKVAWLRNKDDVRIRMYAEHGELRSFLTDKYPEAKPLLWTKKMKQKKQEEDE